MRQQLLICEEAASSPASVSTRLVEAGFSIEPISDKPAAARRLRDDPRPIVVAPRFARSGAGQCAALRWVTRSAVIAVLPEGADGASLPADVVEACLDAGADVVISAALEKRELAARVGAAIRSKPANEPQSLSHETYEYGNLTVNESAHSATVAGERIALTPTEFRLLVALVRRSGHVASHEELITDTWSSSAERSPKMLRLYIGYLRRKLTAAVRRGPLVVNQPGVGYKLIEAVAS